MSQATLRIGVDDDSLIIQIDGKEIYLDTDQALDLFNAVGEALEAIGAFKDCDECPNKDECDSYCNGDGESPCTLH